MFEFYTETTERKVPSSINECKLEDEIAQQLKQKSESVLRGALGIAVIFIIIGLGAGKILGNIFDSFLIGFAIFAITCLIGISIYTLYYTISLLLVAKASEVQSLKIASNLMLYSECKNNSQTSEVGNITQKSSISSVSQPMRKITEDDRWICKNCGKKNPKVNVYCEDCSAHK